ncbi:MAG: Rad2 nuclease [Thelocarpon superellum]|nr:MAG: Rad2 nuclease [Thelocarpon superellum]
MGISGLLPLLKSIHKPCNIKKFAGQTVGVDAYGWLHRATVACAMELALDRPTRKHVDFAMHRVRMLQHYGVIPFLVFDGDYLPSKAATEADRAKKREESKRQGLELHRRGKTAQAYAELQKAVDVTPEMAGQLIDSLKRAGVQYLVAPYEADAQLTYLERQGIISAILSEDSDLLVFGAQCLLTKLDQYGECVEINRADFSACRDISLAGWSDEEFRRMAILSGCDYLASINKMGLKTAYRLVRKHKHIGAIVRVLQFDGHFRVPAGYVEAFHQAELTFLHQRVFCPLQEALVFHTDAVTPGREDEWPFIGRMVAPEIARGVARGELHPMTKEPLRIPVMPDGATRTPWPASTRPPLRTASTGALDLKGNKRIDTFLQHKRTPLAELDPNSFTPSPTQQRLLRQHSSTSWAASPTPATSRLSRSSTSVMPLPASESDATGDDRLTPAAAPWSRSGMAPRPPKRPRLCADDDALSASGTANAELERSRFFTTSSASLASEESKVSGTRAAKKVDRTIFSDDSVEDVMAGMADGCDSARSPKASRISIFQDDPQIFVPRAAGDICAGAGPRDDSDAENRARKTPTASGPRSVTALKALTKNYTYQATRSQEVKASVTSATEASPSSPKVVNPRPRPEPSMKAASTPLQRLGIGALRRAQSCHSIQPPPPLSVSSCTTAPPTASAAPSSARRRIDLGLDADAAVMGEGIICGSEDLIVPDSDDSDDAGELSPIRTDEGAKATVDLESFLFVPG